MATQHQYHFKIMALASCQMSEILLCNGRFTTHDVYADDSDNTNGRRDLLEFDVSVGR
jgi:hypothetical protein